ncbi:hypothetical protein ASG14_16650 [Pedobacter sp. Leaf194]|nr:hypothetical protein ASG14_16650 [Pedobacter sp. Leaf194]
MLETVPDANVFPTSLIAYSILDLGDFSKVNDILQLSASFLQAQSMRGGIWNNFTKAHPYFKVCPPDVDNTSCASILLNAVNREFQSNEAMLLLNRNRNNLFYSWYTFRPTLKWNKDYWLLMLREFKYPVQSLLFWANVEAKKYDIDAVVNANVLFYLGLTKDTSGIINYLLDIILTQKEADCDKWYRNPFTIYYFFSRILYSGVAELEPIRKPITQRIIDTIKQDGSFGESILDTALAVISLIKLNYQITNLEKAINFIVNTQGEYGEWPRWAVYYGGPKKLQCYGSEELTTGFCLEALALYKSRYSK